MQRHFTDGDCGYHKRIMQSGVSVEASNYDVLHLPRLCCLGIISQNAESPKELYPRGYDLYIKMYGLLIC